MIRKILSMLTTKQVLEKIARENDSLDAFEAIEPSLRQLLEQCLSMTVAARPQMVDVASNIVFGATKVSGSESEGIRDVIPTSTRQLMMSCPLKHIYYWWQLAGGDVLVELKRASLIKNVAPILEVPM